MISAHTDEYRRAAVALANVSRQNHCCSALVASATAGEGASTVAVYLGRHLMQDLAFNPVLIELNRIRPAFTRLFRLDPKRSLAAAVSGDLAILDCVQKDPTGLRVIPVGEFQTATGLKDLESALCQAVQGLQNSFDFILADVPPVLESADTLIAGWVIPNVILVVGSGRASQESVRAARAQLADARIQVIGAILNERKRILPRWLRR